MILRDFTRSDIPPRDESPVGNGQSIRYVGTRPNSSDIVIRSMSVFLQLTERVNHILEVSFLRLILLCSNIRPNLAR
jgi:hypothetical protein